MKQTAIQQAIAMVRSRMESQNDTLMGKHTAHHLQQVERDLYVLLEKEKEQMIDVYESGEDNIDSDGCHINMNGAELYYKDTYGEE